MVHTYTSACIGMHFTMHHSLCMYACMMEDPCMHEWRTSVLEVIIEGMLEAEVV